MMSTRLYPMYRRGNPQLRVYLPNFWMKLIKQDDITHTPNKVQFIVSSQMTKGDVKNYLEKIYKVPVMDVKTYNHAAKVEKDVKAQVYYKPDDYKVAFVTLPEDEAFEFPDILNEKKMEEDLEKSNKDFTKMKREYKKATMDIKGRRGVPSFFGL